MASAFTRAGINSANPTMHDSILCNTQGYRPIIRCESNIPYKPYEYLTVVSNDLRIPWSAVSADYMNNIQTQNLTATIKDENVYSASWSGELNYTRPGSYSMNYFEMEEGQVQFENRKGFESMKPELTMQTNLYFSPMFDSYSSSPTWTYSSRS